MKSHHHVRTGFIKPSPGALGRRLLFGLDLGNDVKRSLSMKPCEDSGDSSMDQGLVLQAGGHESGPQNPWKEEKKGSLAWRCLFVSSALGKKRRVDP